MILHLPSRTPLPPLLPPPPSLYPSSLSTLSLSSLSLSSLSLSSSNSALSRCFPPDIDMVPTGDGSSFAPRQPKVVVLWDLDNKPPRGAPFPAAAALLSLASSLGDVVEASAFANRHAFSHLPSWVLDERRERRRLDLLERRGLATPSEPYVCNLCGRKCKTHLDLKKHFKQLHERERQKKLTRMRQLKGKKRQRFKERHLERNPRYEEAARELVTPRVGYGLERELRRAGVRVRTVEDKPQAADWALKRQMMHSMSRGIDWMVLVSDDSDFREMLRRVREGEVGTVVVGDRDGVLAREADAWVPWSGVESGEVGVVVPRMREERDCNGTVEEEEVVVPRRKRLYSAFSDGEEGEEEWLDDDEDDGLDGFGLIFDDDDGGDDGWGGERDGLI